MVTLGVEEEYLLLDPDSGLPLPKGAQVRAAAELAPTVDGGEVDLELLQAQVEVGTPICETLDEVDEHLTRLRAAVHAAASKADCRHRLAAPNARVPRGRHRRSPRTHHGAELSSAWGFGDVSGRL
jgi:gamma-glutamyl:cysteine ligase YbdK (ATP-grasp superfamily)